MDIELDVRKSIEQNAAVYFEKAKKARAKRAGIDAIIARTQNELATLAEKETAQETKPEEEKRAERKWFEKFRWFISSEGFLCVGGRDATTNEIVIKKHTQPGDIIFHADLSGSPFFVVQAEGKVIGESTKKEAAQATASFSRGWKQGLGYLDVFYVNPDQVSKEAQSGEFIAKGAFMIYGKKTTIRADLLLAIGRTQEGLWMCAAPESVKAHCETMLGLRPGQDKPSDIARRLVKKQGGHADDIIRALPPGPCRLVKI